MQAQAERPDWVPARRGLGLRAQILLGLALVSLVAILSTGYLALWGAGATVRVQRESAALALAAAASTAAGAVVDPERPLAAPENRTRLAAMARDFTDRSERWQLSVLGPGREVILTHPPRAPGDVDPPVLLGVLAGIPPVFNYRSRPSDGGTELLAFAAVRARDRTVGAVRVALPAPAPIREVLDRSGPLLLGLALADALLVLALGFFVLTQLVVRPLQAVERATARVSAGDWDQRINAAGPREVAALAAAFNQMTASLASQREQLIRTEKLASVGQLAAGVAHEIGNPLAAILGYVDILRKDAAEAASALAPGDRSDALERVKAETQRIHRIIQDLLEYSRPSREEAQPTDPLKVLKSVQALLEPQARFRRVEIAPEPPASTSWPRVMGSPGRLTQVFVNLLINAADAMEGRGKVVVSCAAVGDRRVAVTFRDDGPGVPPDLRRKIFDPFFTTKAPGQGTGLGLSISRSIVERFGGQLELAPEEAGGKGATFVVTLPAA